MNKMNYTMDDLRGVSNLSSGHYDMLKKAAVEKLLKASSDDAYRFIIDMALSGHKEPIMFLQKFTSKAYAEYIAVLDDYDTIVRDVTVMALNEFRIRREKEKAAIFYEPHVTAVWTPEIGWDGFISQLEGLRVKPEIIEDAVKEMKEFVFFKNVSRHIRYFTSDQLED